MLRFCLAFLLALAPVSAMASSECKPLDRAVFGNKATFTALTSAQLHFAQGAFSAVPPIAAPHGDSALLIQAPGVAAGMLAFMSGSLVCDVMGVGPQFVDLLMKVGEGDLGKPSGDDL